MLKKTLKDKEQYKEQYYVHFVSPFTFGFSKSLISSKLLTIPKNKIQVE